MSEVRWRRVNDEPFEYAIQQGPHGDEFVKLLDGSCLRRRLDEIDDLIAKIDELAGLLNCQFVRDVGKAAAFRRAQRDNEQSTREKNNV